MPRIVFEGRIYPPVNPFPLSADDARIVARQDESRRFTADQIDDMLACQAIDDAEYARAIRAALRADS